MQVANKALSVHEFAGMWYLLLGVVAFGFCWALGERLLVYLVTKFPHLRREVKRANEALAVHGKRFDLSRRFSMRPRAQSDQPSLEVSGFQVNQSSLDLQSHGTPGATRSFGSISPIDRAIRKVDEESAMDLEPHSSGGSKAVAVDLNVRC